MYRARYATLAVKISVIGNNNLLYNETLNISNGTTSSKIINQPLCYDGLWLVTASSNDTRMRSETYSFQTVTNAEEANTEINTLTNIANQQKSSDWTNTLALIAIIESTAFGLVALSISILFYRKKKVEPE
jgi:hypothetical protein